MHVVRSSKGGRACRGRVDAIRTAVAAAAFVGVVPFIPATPVHAQAATRSIPVSDGYVTAADGARLYYRIYGRARDTIIALHGGPGETIASFDPSLKPLAEHHALLLYDQRGNGRSSSIDDSTHLQVAYHVRDLQSIVEQFHMSHVTLLGHSWGVGLAALYAAAHPDRVSRMILVDGVTPRLRPYGKQANKARLAGLDSATMARIATLSAVALADTERDKPALCREFYGLYLRNYFVDRSAMTRTIANDCADTAYSMPRAYRVGVLTSGSWGDWVWDTLETHVTARVLVIRGKQDFIPLAASEAWTSAFTNGRILEIDRSGHFPFVERADEFFPAVEEFLGGGWPAGSRKGHAS